MKSEGKVHGNCKKVKEIEMQKISAEALLSPEQQAKRRQSLLYSHMT